MHPLLSARTCNRGIAADTAQVVDNLVRSGAVDMIVVDSVAALTPRAEIEGEIGSVLGTPPDVSLRFCKVSA